MGDRANVYIKDDVNSQQGIYLYTHYDGHDLPTIVKNALARGKSWWYDVAYLTRIIFCEMTYNDNSGLTGYGISVSMQDNQHPIIVIDTIKQSISFVSEQSWCALQIPYKIMNFQEYIDLSSEEVQQLWK